MKVTELVEEGIRAYTRGDRAEAERCWREALAVEPRHARARAYLVMLANTGRPRTAPVAPPARSPRGEDEEAGYDELPLPWEEGPAPASAPDRSPPLSAPRSPEEAAGRRPPPPAPGTQAVAPSPPAPARRGSVDAWMRRAREQFELGDFSGSAETAQTILRMDPAHAEAAEYLRRSEATLLSMYESKLGRLDQAPRLTIKPEDVMWLNLDQRAGFLLAQVDGTVSYEDLFALSGLSRLETARILAGLVQDGVIR